MTDVIVEIKGLQKSFGSNRVLRSVDVSFKAGEVTALLGANGAGKSTLLGCLSGAVRPDSGEIFIDGVAVELDDPRDSLDAGIGMIYQHFQLIDSLSVAENVFLGAELVESARRINRKLQNKKTQELFEGFGIDVNPRAFVSSLSIGQQQLVEIVRSLSKKPKVLILDEPTSALSHEEVEILLELVSSLARDHGIAIVYVSHVLSEIMQIADRAVILRDGKVYADVVSGQFSKRDLIEYISPNQAKATAEREGYRGQLQTVLSCRNLETTSTGPLNFEVHSGEVLGIFGLMGSGRTSLLETLAGARKGVRGEIYLNDIPVETKSPADAIRSGISLVPSDRNVQALFPLLSASDNVSLPHRKAGSFFRSRSFEKELTESIIAQLRVSPPNTSLAAGLFSGGNAQKLMVGRWANDLSHTKLLLLDEPTQGVDIGARRDIYEFIHTYVGQSDKCAVFATSEYEEAVTLADRILVLHEGKPVEIVAPDISEGDLMSLAFGNYGLEDE